MYFRRGRNSFDTAKISLRNKPLFRWGGLALITLTAAIVTVLAANFISGPVSARASRQDDKGGNKTLEIVNFDIRMTGGNDPERLAAARGVGKADIVQAARNQVEVLTTGVQAMKAAHPAAKVDLSPVTAAVEIVDGDTRPLTGPNRGQSGESIARSFVAANASLYGLSPVEIANLRFIGESKSPTGLRMVRMEQLVNGRPVFQSESRFLIDNDGRMLKSLGSMIPEPAPVPAGNIMSPQDALRATMSQLKVDLDVSKMSVTDEKEGGMRFEMKVDDPRIEGPVTSILVYFPIAPGILVPAWSQVVFGEKQDWHVLVDAGDGTMLWRKNIRNTASAHDARFRVFTQADGTSPADSPAPQSPSAAVSGAGTQYPGIAPTIVSMHTAMNPVASQNGWINDCPPGGCTANETQTIGNNVLACVDLVVSADKDICDTTAASVLDGNGRPTGNPDANGRNRDFLGTAPRDFQTNFLPAPQGGNPEAGQIPNGAGAAQTQFRRGSVTQQFYTANWYHDKLFALGFDEAAGNFQQINFSGMGLGGDRVNLDVQDGDGSNNANFGTPPDGTSGRAQMFIFNGSTVNRDGGLDAEILLHELTHGTSNRLLGNGDGLVWSIGAGLGEGWSDFYALSLLNNTNADDPDGRYASGAYATYKLGGLLDNYVYGIRRFPYSTNNSVNPLTWADVDDVTNNMSGGIGVSPLDFNGNGGAEVHNIGEIWTLTLWEVRSRIIAANGGDVPAGNQVMLRIVTDAMKMTPANPSFIQARNALISADCASNACANEQSIWDGFADRGLGYKAVAPLRQVGFGNSVHVALGESFTSPNLDTNTITVDDSTTGNNNGAIDPNEPVKITVNLINPWRAAGKSIGSATATLTTSTAGVVITDNSSTYGAIPPSGNATGDSFAFTVPNAATCGQSLKFTVQIVSSLGTISRDFTVRVGAPAGTAAPITYTRSSVGLSIPDSAPRGVSDGMNITDDFEIADLNLKIDSLTHTFTGDLTVMLRGPNGYGSDNIWLRGALFGDGDGDNFTNTIIDDQATDDLNQAPSSAAPFTGSWKSAFNSPVWNLFGNPAIFPDSVGVLGRYNGMSTQGNWRLHVADRVLADTGTLNSWSIIVTPKAFACTPFVAAPTTTTVSSSANPSVFGESVLFTATVSPVPTGGTITFIEGGTCAAPAFTWAPNSPVSATGTAAFSTTSLAVGSHTITACYSGVPTFQASTGFVVQTVTKASSTTTIVSDNPDASVFGENYTVAVTVVANAPSVVTPQGTVSVSDGSSTCGITLAAGAGSCSLPSTSVGPKTLTATYSGSATVLGSSDTEAHTVNKANTTTALTASPNPTTYGQSLTLTATMTAVGPGSGTAGGTVNFSDGATAIGSCQGVPVNLSGVAVCTVNSLSAGAAKSLSAVYSGDANFNGSNGSTTQTINKAVLTVTADPQTRTYGAANPTLTYSLAGFVLGQNLATSDVTGNPLLSTAASPGSNVGSYPITLGLGTLSSSNYTFSLTPGSLTVTPATLTVTADNKSRAYGAANPALTYQFSGFVLAQNATTGGVTGTPALSTTAIANSSVGAYPIAITAGSLAATNYTFTFANGTLTVTPAILTVTANSLTRVYGQANPTLTYQITGFVNGETLATSGVTGTPAVSTSAGQFSAPGTYAITVGAGTLAATNYQFTFVPGTLTITQAATTVAITNAGALLIPTTVGQAYAVNFTVSPVAPGSGAPTGAVTVSDGTATCTATLIAANNGVGSCALTSTTPGDKTITASYAGDTNFTGSVSAGVPHRVILSITGNIKQFVSPAGPNTNLAGVTVLLTSNGNPASATAVTDASGNYAFALLSAGSNIAITPSGLGKTFEPTSRSYSNVTANITGADFLAYDGNGANSLPRELKVVNTVGTPGQAVTVPVTLSSLGNETSVSFSLAFDTARLGVPTSATCGSDFTGCTVAVFNNATPGRVGVTVTRAAAMTAGLREVVRVTFPTFASTAGSAQVTFADTPVARATRNTDGNPLPTLYTAGFISFTPDVEGDVVGANGAAPGGDGVLANDVTIVRQMALGLIQPTAGQYQRADAAPRSTLGDGCPINSADVTQVSRYNLGLDAPTGTGGPTAPIPGGCTAPNTRPEGDDATAASGSLDSLNVTASLGGEVVAADRNRSALAIR